MKGSLSCFFSEQPAQSDGIIDGASSLIFSLHVRVTLNRKKVPIFFVRLCGTWDMRECHKFPPIKTAAPLPLSSSAYYAPDARTTREEFFFFSTAASWPRPSHEFAGGNEVKLCISPSLTPADIMVREIVMFLHGSMKNFFILAAIGAKQTPS